MYLFSPKPLEELWDPPPLLFSGYNDLGLFIRQQPESGWRLIRSRFERAPVKYKGRIWRNLS
jgi:hypothetical protein